MKQVTKCWTYLLQEKSNANAGIINTLLFKNIFLKFFLMSFMLFGLSDFSFAQTTSAKRTTYIRDLVNAEHNINERLEIDKQAVRADRKELREERNIKNEISDIPNSTVQKFKENYPKAKRVNWVEFDGYVTADYKLHKKPMVNVYNFNNKLVGKGKYVSFKSLPQKDRKQIHKYYKKYVPEATMYYYDRNENPDAMAALGILNTQNHDYYVLMRSKKNLTKQIVLQVTPGGDVSYFTEVPENS